MKTPGGSMLPNQMDLSVLKAAITKPAFNAWLGVQFEGLDKDGLRLSMPWREEIASNQERGYAHGGVLASLVDIATFYVVAAQIGNGGPTVDLRVDYHRPALPGKLHVTATILRLGRTIASAEAQVTDSDGKMLVSGRAVFFVGATQGKKTESIS